MKALKIVIKQNRAHFKKPECYTNRMSYPLPPVSTIIGAIHNACGYKEYVPMDISVQGKYQSMQKRYQNLKSFLDSARDDRGTLVKMKVSGILSNDYIVVSEALAQEVSHKKEKKVRVYNKELLEEYKKLLKEPEIIKEQKKIELEDKEKNKKEFNIKLKGIKDKKSQEYLDIKEKILLLTNEINSINEKYKKLENERNYKYSFFKTVNTNPSYIEEVLDGILVIHIKTEDESKLDEILDNVYNISHLGRSEDSCEILEASIVDIFNPKEEISSLGGFSTYIPVEFINSKEIIIEKGKFPLGTCYFLDKNYIVVDGKRVFNKTKSLFLSNYTADEQSTKIYVDKYKGKDILVTFI